MPEIADQTNTSDEPIRLNDAINKAVESTDVEESESTETESNTTETETSDQTSSQLNETELAQAQQLYLALKDPDQAPRIIEYIAKEAGYSKVETKQEIKEAKDAVLEHLQESLGPDFEFLTPKLSTAINKILETKLAEHTRDIRENIAAERESKIRTETSTAYQTLSNKYFGKDEMPASIMTEMSKLMEAYKPAANMSVNEYLSDMLQTAAARLNVDLKKVKTNQQNETRVARNRNDAIGRLASERGAITESSVIGTPQNKKLSLNEAIRKAEEEISASEK